VTFLIDMNLSPEWVELLKESGIDAFHWSRLGKMNAADDVLFDRARAEGWAILTQDLDFSKILFKTAANGPSTVMLRLGDELNLENRRRVVAIILRCQSEIESGALLVIDEHRARLRPLPL
jgi:predicted nuclease of predicted toxin-antitoxin system